MKFVLVVLFFSQFVMAQTFAELKNKTYQECLSEGKIKQQNDKNNLFKFLDLCIMYAANNIKNFQEAKVCLEVAKLGDVNDVKELTLSCKKHLGYQLCRADADNFTKRLNCVTSKRSLFSNEDCEKEVKELDQIRKQEKSIKLTAQQLEVFKKGFCGNPARPTQSSPDGGSVTPSREQH